MYVVKYPAAFKAHKVKESELGPAGKRDLKEIKEIETGYDQLQTSLEEEEDEKEVQKIQRSINTVEPTLKKLDDKLCFLISKNKSFKEKAEHMKKSKGQTKAPVQAAPTPEPIVEPMVEPPVNVDPPLPPVSAGDLKIEPVVEPVQEPPVEPAPVVETTPTPEPVAEPKKGGNQGLLIGLASAVLVGLGWGAMTNFKFNNPFKRK